jgi:hypothetical protein
VARLRKSEVEALLASYDAEPVRALTVALRVVLERPGWSWEQLAAALPPERRAALLAAEPAALDSLAAELNELRHLPDVPG